MMFKHGLLRGRRILVTGGGTGLGKGMAEKFLELGAEIFICGRRKSVCEATAAELTAKHGGKVGVYGVDIRDAAAVDAMVADIFASGPLTDLINNAAGNFISRTEDLSPRGFDAVANIVMHGTFYVTHAVGRRWIAGGHRGNVVSIVVTWVYNGSPYVVPSAMSKSAINTMTMSLATEWAKHGIRLNAIAPGVIPTEGASKRLSPGEGPTDRTRARQSHGPGWYDGGAAKSRDVSHRRRLRMADRRNHHARRRSKPRHRLQISTNCGLVRRAMAGRARGDQGAKRKGPGAAFGVVVSQPRARSGTKAKTRSGLPLPSRIFSGAATISAPVGGNRSRLHRHCSPYLPAPCM